MWGEVGARVAEIAPMVMMCLGPPVFHLFPLSFPFSLPPSSHSELLLLTNVFLGAPSMALVDLSNICLWVAQTLAKCKPLSCTSEGEWGFFLGGGGDGGCVLCLAHYSLGNEFGSGEAC